MTIDFPMAISRTVLSEGQDPGEYRERLLARFADLGRLGPGLLGGWMATHLIAERLYKAGPADPELWLVTGGAIALTIVVAGLVPALRASRIQPMEALRYE